MNSKRLLNNTYVSQSAPWGLYARTGHRLLCSDGQIRAASLASTADTFFSVPASVRVNGKTVSGYMTTEGENGASTGTPVAYVFRHHTKHADKLPVWPDSFTPGFAQLMAKAIKQESVCPVTGMTARDEAFVDKLSARQGW